MGAGCSSQTSVVFTNSRIPKQTSSTRLLGALGHLSLTDAPPPSTEDSQSELLTQELDSKQPQQLGLLHSPQHTTEVKANEPISPPPFSFPDPVPSPAHTPLPHTLTPGIDIQPTLDKPGSLLKQRQTIPPMDLDYSLSHSTAQLSTESIAPSTTRQDISSVGSPTSPISPNSTSPTPNEEEEEEEEEEAEEEEDEGEDNGHSEDADEESEGGLSRSSSAMPTPNKLLPSDHSRRRNSISVLPSIEVKPKFPGGSNEGKKSDPDLVLWIANKLKTKLKLTRISKAYDRFIPSNFYNEMGKQDIREVDLGECVIVRKSILFCDIRNFTSFSSKIGPQDTFKFINAFSRRLLPVVRKHGGYIDKFIGDALVALFPSPAQGILAGQAILVALEEYNKTRFMKALPPIRVGIGCHTGTLMLGTVGDNQRMDGIAIGNVISLASQVEMSTKLFGVDFIATKVTLMGLKEEDKTPFVFRKLGRIKEGTDDDQLMDIFQICPTQSSVNNVKDTFEEAVNLFQQKSFAEASEKFRECTAVAPEDKPSLVLENRAQHFLACTFLPADWGNALTYHTEFMTQSTGAGVLHGQPPGFSSAGGGNNANIVLMRLVFSAIFHMQKKLMSEEEKEASDESQSNEPSVNTSQEVPSGRFHLPPINKPQHADQNAAAKDKDHEKEESEKPKEKDTGKERELITLVLSGFENHNRVNYLTKAYQRFVPNDFLSYLGKESVQNVDIGDSMMTNITTMFIEIHGFQPKSRIISEQTLNKLNNMKRYSEAPPLATSPSSSSSKPSSSPSGSGGSSLSPTPVYPGATLQSTPSSATLQPTPSSATLQPSISGRKLGRMASKNTASLRADLFSFQFLNTISQKILPIIRQCDGYVDKFFGNAILALFPSLDAATSAGLQIMAAVKSFDTNSEESEDSTPPYAQIGMNSGNVILGTVGDGKRMDGTVIGNTVNVAARMLSLTKVYGTKFVTTSKCIAQLGGQSQPSPPQSSIPSHPPNSKTKDNTPPSRSPISYKFYNQRVLDTVKVPGKDEAIVIHEIFENESQVAQIKGTYESGLALYQERKFEEARNLFESALQVIPNDIPSQMLRDKCSKCIREGVPADWDAVSVVTVK